MRRTASLMIACACLAPLPVPAQEAPELTADQRIKLLAYHESDVYTIPTKYGYQTNIVFSPSEEIQTISMGDRSLWQIIPAANRIFIRPMEDGVVTNMTVLTSRRSYQFDLKSLGQEEKGEILYVAKFIYPGSEGYPFMDALPASSPAFTPPPPAPAPASSAGPVHPNYNYTYSGPDDLAPLQVFDNGRSTFLKFGNMTEALPNVYLADGRGYEARIPYQIKDEFMVVDHVMEEFALKSSNGTVTVYNEMLNPR